MLFACGMGVGLFFYGVGEPVAHYTGNNKFYADPYLPGNSLSPQPTSNLKGSNSDHAHHDVSNDTLIPILRIQLDLALR